MGALIHFYFHVDPDTLDDETFAKYIARLKYALKITKQWDQQM